MKFSNLYLVGGLVALIGISSFNQPFNNAHAALTAPATWTFKYTNQDFPGYKIRSQTAVVSTPSYTRTADGIYYNYTNTSTITTGLTVTQTFNRSNTTWYTSGSTYIPNDTKIGSNASVGTISKEYLKFDNQTSKDYYLYLDKSSNAGFLNYQFLLNGLTFVNTSGGLYMHVVTSLFMNLVIPSYSTFEMISLTSSSAVYIDAWYLQDLGVSAAYDAGVDDGIIQGEQSADSTVLLDAVETVVGISVNFLLMIMTFSIFDISLLNIALVLVSVIGIVWILKALRG